MSAHPQDAGRVKALMPRDVAAMKAKGARIVAVTAYDVLQARLVDAAGVDVVLVGDSLGNVVAGEENTRKVPLDAMIWHGAAVRRGLQRALLVIDMPWLTYQVSADEAVRNCGRVLAETGASSVKMEGGTPPIIEAVRRCVEVGIPVMGHIGYTPQTDVALGGARVQGRDAARADALLAEARALEEAGAFAVVLELVPANVAARITDAIGIPTIGIGAGASCDGQVLVLPDLLGLNEGFRP
ncbi:MAG: 3-methyl-2-oxobutanoate hydroxymethyltransferase, partial [Gemmatimonadaceae bacterium]|nr:3-methyl-2-oxobutanoate hydroxymethyltransferase [Gemmatimonadaceae bacterium]